MPTYRIYVLNDRGKITGIPTEAQFASDEDAIAAARTWLDQHDSIEVWQLARFVARVNSAD